MFFHECVHAGPFSGELIVAPMLMQVCKAGERQKKPVYILKQWIGYTKLLICLHVVSIALFCLRSFTVVYSITRRSHHLNFSSKTISQIFYAKTQSFFVAIYFQLNVLVMFWQVNINHLRNVNEAVYLYEQHFQSFCLDGRCYRQERIYIASHCHIMLKL